MPSVLFLSLMNSAAWGGSEEIWYKSAMYLTKKNFRVGICCFNWHGKEEKIQQLTEAGCELFLLPAKNETISLRGKFKLKKKLQSVRFKNYDRVIVNQGGWKDIVHGPFKELFKVLPPYCLLFHNYDENDLLQGSKKKIFSEWVHRAEKNIGDAARIFSAIKKSIDIEVPRQEILFNPIAFPQPNNITPFHSSPSGKLIFAMLAELDTKRKAQDKLITALAGHKWKERNFELNFYGKGHDQSYLEYLIKDKQLFSKIFLKGYTKNVEEALTHSHIVLQITNFDAMPIAVTEAIALSRPVIVSHVGDMPLWIKDEVNGWVACNTNIEEIDLVLEKVWQNRERLEEMGKESFRIFKEKYPVDPIEYFLKQVGIEFT
jgi:glycosyltransferase involved in cell wall biosynthesis